MPGTPSSQWEVAVVDRNKIPKRVAMTLMVSVGVEVEGEVVVVDEVEEEVVVAAVVVVAVGEAEVVNGLVNLEERLEEPSLSYLDKPIKGGFLCNVFLSI
jgi:hypothetical protein